MEELQMKTDWWLDVMNDLHMQCGVLFFINHSNYTDLLWDTIKWTNKIIEYWYYCILLFSIFYVWNGYLSLKKSWLYYMEKAARWKHQNSIFISEHIMHSLFQMSVSSANLCHHFRTQNQNSNKATVQYSLHFKSPIYTWKIAAAWRF